MSADDKGGLAKLREQVSTDMDRYLPLHSPEWDYAKSVIVRIDEAAALEAKDIEGRAGNEGSGNTGIGLEAHNPEPEDAFTTPSSPRPDSESKAKDIELEGLRKKVEAKRDVYVAEQRRLKHPENRVNYELAIAALNGVLKLIAAATEKGSK